MNSEWNLKEKLEIKLHDDIRRIQIHNKDVTYDHLIEVMQQLFNGKMSKSDEVLLKYSDEDGDLVTIFDNSDLENAIESRHHTLKLMIFLNCQAQESTGDINKHDQGFVANQVSAIRKELACIRDQVLHLLDELDTPQDTLSGKVFQTNKLITPQDTLSGKVFQTNKLITYQEQGSIVGKNEDRIHLVMSTDTQSTSEKANDATLPQFDQLEPGMYGNSSISGGENALLKHSENWAAVSPYPSEYEQQVLSKRGYQPLLSSTSYGLPTITVYPAPDEPSTQESANYPVPSYSPQPIQQQSYNHQLISSDPQGSSEHLFTDPSSAEQMQIQTSLQRQLNEYYYNGYHLSNAVQPVNPYRRSPRRPDTRRTPDSKSNQIVQ